MGLNSGLGPAAHRCGNVLPLKGEGLPFKGDGVPGRGPLGLLFIIIFIYYNQSVTKSRVFFNPSPRKDLTKESVTTGAEYLRLYLNDRP